jgi:hypothetical protein
LTSKKRKIEQGSWKFLRSDLLEKHRRKWFPLAHFAAHILLEALLASEEALLLYLERFSSFFGEVHWKM